MKLIELVNSGSKKLLSKKILSHKLDSELLLSKVLNKKREYVILNFDKKIDKPKIYEFNKLIKRRLSKEPIAYILKQKEFWSKNFYINKNSLIPRPETELMVEKLINIFKNKKISILDIGTGSGCILISLLNELKKSKGLGIDISKNTLAVAMKNAKKHSSGANIRFLRRSLSEIHHCKFDLIVSNPPYIKTIDLKNLEDEVKIYEPKLALDGGNDGLDVIKKVIYKSKEILKFRALLALEIGNGQYKKVSDILKKNNFKIEHNIKDYKDNTRCLISSYIKNL